MSFQNRLKEQRENIGMSRAELAEILGVTQAAIGNYENGVSTPKADILFKVFDALKCDANYLFQDEMNETTTPFTPSVKEMEHIKKYRSLDDYGKKAVDMVLENELYRARKQNVITQMDAVPYVPEVLAASRPNEQMEDVDRADLDDVLKLVEKEKKKQKINSVKKYDEPER